VENAAQLFEVSASRSWKGKWILFPVGPFLYRVYFWSCTLYAAKYTTGIKKTGGKNKVEIILQRRKERALFLGSKK